MSEWISVKDRVPETQEEVLTYSQCNGVRAGSLIAKRGGLDKDIWYLCRTEKISVAVTHWMPLPEPPEG